MMSQKVVTNRREVKKADTRRALLEAAGELFRTNGYQNTTVGQIADSADVSERTFFRYFESKEDLLLPDLVDFLDRIATQLELSPPSQQPIESLMESVKKVLAEGRGGERSLLLQLPALSDSVPATRVAKIFLNWEARIVASMKVKVRAINPGLADSDVVAVVSARCGIAAMRTTFEAARSISREGGLAPGVVVEVLAKAFDVVSNGCVIETDAQR